MVSSGWPTERHPERGLHRLHVHLTARSKCLGSPGEIFTVNGCPYVGPDEKQSSFKLVKLIMLHYVKHYMLCLHRRLWPFYPWICCLILRWPYLKEKFDELGLNCYRLLREMLPSYNRPLCCFTQENYLVAGSSVLPFHCLYWIMLNISVLKTASHVFHIKDFDADVSKCLGYLDHCMKCSISIYHCE